MVVVDIAFKRQFEDKMKCDIKRWTSRTHIMGQEGDDFQAFGMWFTITDVQRYSLGYVRDFHWREEGVESPEAFQKVWEEIHPKKGFDAEEMVWVHVFARHGIGVKVEKVEEPNVRDRDTI